MFFEKISPCNQLSNQIIPNPSVMQGRTTAFLLGKVVQKKKPQLTLYKTLFIQ